MRILIADDSIVSRHLLDATLRKWGYDVIVACDGNEAWSILQSENPPKLAILDWVMPGLTGPEVCRRVRASAKEEKDIYTYILLLTSKSQREDLIEGMESGADDYLTKPFGIREFIARVRALLRRRPSRAPGHAAAVLAGGLTVDPARRHARLDDREIELTAHEFDLLYLLATNRGIVFSRDALMQKVWGDDTHITERSVDTLVKRVRRKIEQDPADPRFVLTVWGTGYKFADV